MIRMMMIGLTATSVALAGGVTSPAQAGDKKLGRLLAGAAVLFIIAKSIDDDKRRDKHQVAEVAPLPPLYFSEQETDDLSGYDVSEDDIRVEPLPETGRRELTGEPLELALASPTILPSACTFEVNGSFGAETVAGKDCLNANFQDAHSLPAFCAKSIETTQGSRQVFDLGCLERWGYMVEARR
ncbi:MAG: hypothetical protein ABI459_08025 [Deltaproteobacteria bacterium]